MSCIVIVGFGKESSRRYADSSDIPGLNVETETFKEFVEVILAASSSEIDFHQHVVRAA
jgi:hypothetical protein